MIQSDAHTFCFAERLQGLVSSLSHVGRSTARTWLCILFALTTLVLPLTAQENETSPQKKEVISYIEMKNGNKVKGRILSQDQSKFVVLTPSDDTLEIMAAEVEEIRDWDEVTEIVESQEAPIRVIDEREKDPVSNDFNKNLVSINVVQFLFKNVAVSYEHIFAGGIVGLKIPITIGLENSPAEIPYYLNKVYAWGVDLNFYLGGQGKARCYIGPGFERGRYWYQVPSTQAVRNSPPGSISVSYNSLCFNAGLMVTPSSQFSFSFLVGLGYRKDREEDFLNYELPAENNLAYNLGIILSYRFGKE